jgi:hypothetical protein
MLDSAWTWDVQEKDVPDVVTLFATMVGTDFNEGGLQNHGPKKSQELIALLQKAWQQQDSTLDFDAFVEKVISSELQVEGPKMFQTFLQVCCSAQYYLTTL